VKFGWFIDGLEDLIEFVLSVGSKVFSDAKSTVAPVLHWIDTTDLGLITVIVIGLMLCLVGFFSISSACEVLRYVLWRLLTPGLRTRTKVRETPSDIRGQVSFDIDGPYIGIPNLPGKRIRIQHGSWGEALTKLATSPQTHWFEAKVPGNEIASISKLPSFSVGLGCTGDPDSIVGMGSRVRMEKDGNVLLTATHVMRQLDRGIEPTLFANGRSVPFDREWCVSYYSSSSDLDVIGIDVPSRVWSFLGVTVAKIDPNPPEKFTVEIYGYTGPTPAMSLGRAQKGHHFGITHFASTEPGWSGSPLMHKGKIVGLHRGFQPGGFSNYGVGLAAFVAGFETKDRSKGWTRVDNIDDNYETYSVLLRGRKAELRSARGMYSVQSDPNWTPSSGRKWSDMVDEDDDELPAFPTFESKRMEIPKIPDGPITLGSLAGQRPAASAHTGGKVDLMPQAPRVHTRTVPVSVVDEVFASFRATAAGVAPPVVVPDAKIRDNLGNEEASRQSGGVTQNSQILASTTGATKPLNGPKDGSSAAEQAAPSTNRPSQKSTKRGQSASDSPGQTGERQQKSKASSSKPTAERRKAKEDGKELAPAQNTVTSSKTLQARVDSIRSELLKPQVSSESGAKAYTLLRDLLSYAMRCESNRV
jgi:hypothetical protein